MNRYELTYIIDAALEEDARKELIERFTGMIVSNGGTVEKVDEWGKRRLAYAINYKTEGYYVLTTFSAGPEVPKEIERNLEISESILRYLVIKLVQKKSGVKPRPVRVPAPAPAAPEAAAEPVSAPAAPQAEPAPAEPAPQAPAAE